MVCSVNLYSHIVVVVIFIQHHIFNPSSHDTINDNNFITYIFLLLLLFGYSPILLLFSALFRLLGLIMTTILTIGYGYTQY